MFSIKTYFTHRYQDILYRWGLTWEVLDGLEAGVCAG